MVAKIELLKTSIIKSFFYILPLKFANYDPVSLNQLPHITPSSAQGVDKTIGFLYYLHVSKLIRDFFKLAQMI